jgi:hypothetical protein
MEGLDLQVNDANSQMELLSMLVRSVDRRQNARVAADGVVRLRADDMDVDAQLLDLSVGSLGCSVLRSVALPVGARVELSLPLAEKVLKLDAIIRRRTPAQARDDLEVEFQNLSEADIAAINGYMSYLALGDGDDPIADARFEADAHPTEKQPAPKY